jgi:hypothetical protein
MALISSDNLNTRGRLDTTVQNVVLQGITEAIQEGTVSGDEDSTGQESTNGVF